MTVTSPIKVGIVGIGRAGWGMHCEELDQRRSTYQIVAACDLLATRRARMADRYGCATYERIEDLIADPQVELVAIATRSCDHFHHTKLALGAGKDVFLEKPMCATYEEAVALQEIAEASSGHLYIRQNRRFETGFQHIHEIIASGILGEVFEIKLRRVQFQRRDDWQTLKVYGGGQLLNWGPHIIDHALCFLESPVAQMWSSLNQVAAAGDAEDHLKIVLTGANGRVVDLEISSGALIGEPEFLIWGSCGALTCTGDVITIKYLDPASPLLPRLANPGTPGEEEEIPIPEHQRVRQQAATIASPDALHWIEQTFPAAPQYRVDMSSIWDVLYQAIREGAPYPITLDHVVEIMRIVSQAKVGTAFTPSVGV